ncbi:arylamine N-acetyltransferase [Streptomyces sp. MI02-7b]|uniref:arylamine N-acetyltransferase family protein n=1 Tax=Streptomyces sp. MI02-7b TaxID=462941 RepID=UPI0029AF101E|nr:arylamine N-acetyltransferase [Streptomyces sp. MI02-7b]MDX3077414.1 arylamine N-acetyltransferase [Streptomyces sp. MI02-7b]
MDASQADAYLRRIGAPRPTRPDADALRELHVRHLVAVPFENLSLHLGEPVTLVPDALHDKIVGARRGGYCYELNGAFAALLTALGYDVGLLACRGISPDGLGIPYDHLALRVRTADGATLLADVGFGRHAHHPLPLTTDTDQSDPGGVFRFTPAPLGDPDLLHDGTPVYRLDLRPRELADFEVGSWYQQTSPRSHFTTSLVCSRLTDDGGRLTLTGRTLITTAPDGTRHEVPLDTDSEVLEAYRDGFGLALDRVPRLRAPLGLTAPLPSP